MLTVVNLEATGHRLSKPSFLIVVILGKAETLTHPLAYLDRTGRGQGKRDGELAESDGEWPGGRVHGENVVACIYLDLPEEK